MVNRRILIFGLIAILGISVIKLGTNLVKDNMASNEADIEIIRSDDNEFEAMEDEGMRKTVFYFSNEEGFLVPVMKRIPWDDGIAQITLSNMVDTAELRESLEDTGLSPIIPAGTEIRGIAIDETTGICSVDFSEEIRNTESEKEEENLIKGVVYTLTEFPAINEVQIMVEGEVVPSLSHDMAINEPISRDNINLIGNLEEGRSKVVVYYKDGSGEEFEHYIPVTVPTFAAMNNVYSSLALLFEGAPEESGLKADIPQGVSFEAVEIDGGIAFVDIEVADDVDISDAQMNSMIKSIGLTLSEFEEIETVELIVDGKVTNTAIPVFANEY